MIKREQPLTKTIFISPHVDDFIFAPIQYKLLGRKSLGKYKDSFVLLRERTIRVLINDKSSALFGKNTFRLPWFLRKILARGELYLWAYLNRLSIDIVDSNNIESRSKFFCFSFKSINAHSREIVDTINSNGGELYCHISHYHVDAKSKSEILKLVKNLSLLADTDCSHAPLFKRIYYWYNQPIKRLCFNLGEVKPLEENKTIDVVALGTYHIFSLEWNYYRYSDSITATGFCTLHPDRLLAAQEPANDTYLVHVYPFREYSKKRSLLKHFNIVQKKYFSINIKQLMAKSRYIIPGIEITGIPSTVAFEGLSHGCKILTTNELLHLWPNELRDLVCVCTSFSREDVITASLNDNIDPRHLSERYLNLIKNIRNENRSTISEILNEERI